MPTGHPTGDGVNLSGEQGLPVRRRDGNVLDDVFLRQQFQEQPIRELTRLGNHVQHEPRGEILFLRPVTRSLDRARARPRP